jgi:hypothetical protein
LFNFSIGAGGVVTIQSFGYGGGTNAAGMSIPAGGFDPLLTIFASDGSEVGSFDDDPGCAHSNLLHGACLDSYYSAFLAADTYTLALTESGNVPNGQLSDGFSQQGNGNFAGGFVDFNGFQEDGHWAIDIGPVDTAAIPGAPEPASFGLAGAGLAAVCAIGASMRRRGSGRCGTKGSGK